VKDSAGMYSSDEILDIIFFIHIGRNIVSYVIFVLSGCFELNKSKINTYEMTIKNILLFLVKVKNKYYYNFKIKIKINLIIFSLYVSYIIFN